MKRILPALVAVTLAGCQTAAMKNVNSPAYRIPSGSTLTLTEALHIPAGTRHVKLQHGKPVAGVDEYKVNCQFRVYDLGVESIRPDTFIIARAGDGQEWQSRPYVVRYYKELRLRSEAQPQVVRLICQKWDDPRAGRSISVPNMRDALGHYVSFDFAQSPPQ